MYKKQLEQILVVGFKYFFDLDFYACSHVLITVLVMAGLFRLFFTRIISTFQGGLLTIKEDALSIKATMASYRERWVSNAA